MLKNNFEQNTTVEWADDNKSATLSVAGKLQAGEYTVNVSGLDGDNLTGSVKVEDQKVDSIEISDDVAVLGSEGETATVSYQVKDQYGDDITDSTSLTTNSDEDVEAKDGVVTISNLGSKEAGDNVAIVLVDSNSGETASKTVELSDASAIDSINVDGVYNEDGNELNDDSDASNFSLVLDLKDQYGNEFLNVNKAQNLIASSSNTNVVDVNSDNIKKEEIDGEEKLLLPLSGDVKAGTSNILLISSTTGNKAEYEVNVAETTRTDAVQVSKPEIAVAEEEVLLPLSVQDKQGNDITDLDILTSDKKGIKIDGESATEDNFKVKDGQVFIKQSAGSETGYNTVTVTTATNEVANTTYEVKEASEAKVVRGLKEPLVIKAGKTEVLDQSDFVIEDQYGREMKDDNVQKSISIEIIADEDGEVVTVDRSNKVSAKDTNGKATLNVSLDGVDGSTAEVPVRVTDGTEYDDYEIASIGTVQVANDEGEKVAGPQTFTVNGLLDGGKVALDSTEYTANVTGGDGNASVSDGEIIVNKSNLETDSSDNPVDTEFTLNVTINATGDKLEETFTVSDDEKEVEEFFFTKGNGDYDDAKAIDEAELKTGQTVADANVDGTDVFIATVDQYGNENVTKLTKGQFGDVTLVPEKASEVEITSNGTGNAQVESLRGNDTEKANVTATVDVGNATEELNLTVTEKTPEQN